MEPTAYGRNGAPVHQPMPMRILEYIMRHGVLAMSILQKPSGKT
jgi:hypothetical protein